MGESEQRPESFGDRMEAGLKKGEDFILAQAAVTAAKAQAAVQEVIEAPKQVKKLR